MTLRDRGKRRVTLPRQRPAPEHNLIQAPQMVRALQRSTGLRQSHITPALQEGLQPVIVAGDVRTDPKSLIPESYAAFTEKAADGINTLRACFLNPYNSERIAVLRRLHVYEDPSALGSSYVVYNLVNQSAACGTGFTLKRGQKLVTTYTAGVEPTTKYEIPDTNQSAMGWVQTPARTGLDGAYIWQAPFGGAIAGAEMEVLENFEGERGPRVILYPASSFQVYVLDVNAHYWANLWWDEYPLT